MAPLRNVVLNGHRGEKRGAMVVTKNRNAHAQTSGVVVRPMLLCTAAVKKQRPEKKRPRESWSSYGRKAAISNTFHWARAGFRYWRARRRSRGAEYSIARYSRSHCFTRMPNDAEERLRRRLVNHRTFTRMAHSGGSKGGGEGGGEVELMKPGP